MLDAPMLCAGYRLVKREDGFAERIPCEKLADQLAEHRAAQKIKVSGIPTKFVDDWGGEFETFPQFATLSASNESRERLWQWGLHLLDSGKRFKYIPVQLLLKDSANWANLLDLLGMRYDVLVLDRYDLGAAPDMALDLLAELVWFRYNHDLSTLVTYSKRRERATSEVAVYDLFDQWNQL
jgi:hypothetical protein